MVMMRFASVFVAASLICAADLLFPISASGEAPISCGARLETETRVFLTDAAARRRFGAYWLVVRPFSGLTRRLWLRAAKRRAER